MLDFSKKAKKIEKDSYFFWAILILCFLIIGESIWVVDKFVSKRQLISPTEKFKEIITQQGETKKAKEVEVWLEGEQNLVVNELSEIEMGITGLEDTQTLGADFVLLYDPRLVKIVDQDTIKTGVQIKTLPNELGEVARNLVEEEKGRIIVSLVNLDKKGVLIQKDKKIPLAQISFVPLSLGEIKFSFQLASQEEPGTKITKVDQIPSLATLVAKDYKVSVVELPKNFPEQ